MKTEETFTRLQKLKAVWLKDCRLATLEEVEKLIEKHLIDEADGYGAIANIEQFAVDFQELLRTAKIKEAEK
jgi:hypothetical protein